MRAASAMAVPGVTFEQSDIESFVNDASRGPFDLVFSNAALHWLPDHPRLFARLAQRLADEGQLAVQIPDNFDSHSHTAARHVAELPEFREHLARSHAPGALRAEQYAELLYRLGFRAQKVRLTVYPHVLPTRRHAVEWARGSILTPYRARLTDEEYARFESAYAEELFERLGAKRDDEPVFFPYRRLLIAARR